MRCRAWIPGDVSSRVSHPVSSPRAGQFLAFSTELLQKLKMSLCSKEQRQTAVPDLLQLHPLMNSAESSETSARKIRLLGLLRISV